MGVLRQKCVPTYESFLNNSNFSSIGFNMSYKSYLKQMDNESMLRNCLFIMMRKEEIFYEFDQSGCDYLMIIYCVQEIDVELIRVYRDRC